jgi:RimJ/RimL family protein N-acetyltransferase
MAEPTFADKPTLAGELVVLREIVAGDMAASLEDPEVYRLTGTHRTFTRAELEKWAESRAGLADRLDMTILDRATGRYLGGVHLMNLDAGNRSCTFRIALDHSQVFGRGFGTEATRLVLAHAFETVGVHRVQLEVYAFNPRARHVYEKIGFVHEGTLRHALRWDGEWIDADVMSILAGEWAQHRGRPA